MLRLSHVLHPVRSTRSLARKVQMALYSPFANRKLGQVRRMTKDRCWCGGELLAFQWHESYGICARCATYVNRKPPVQEELNRLYSLDLYWRLRQRQKGVPAVESRGACYRNDGRLQQWLDLVRKYGPASGRVIEVGCAPGILLEELRQRGYDCVGVEISNDVADWIRNTTQLDIRSGFFPGIDLPIADLFLSFDVLEHSPCPDEFLREAARRLVPGGVIIIQTPIDRYTYEPPFGLRFDLFDDLEHLFLFKDSSLKALAEVTNLDIVSLKENLWLGGEVCVFRKKDK